MNAYDLLNVQIWKLNHLLQTEEPRQITDYLYVVFRTCVKVLVETRREISIVLLKYRYYLKKHVKHINL